MFRVYFSFLFLLLSIIACSVRNSVVFLSATPPIVDVIQQENGNLRKAGNNILLKNKYGLWEMYLSGNALEIGLSHGVLGQDLLQKQEKIFFQKVEKLVPKKSTQWFLRHFLQWYNRKMPQYVREDFQQEIFGISRYTTDEYDWLAPKFERSLYLHSAHDIGHALQDLMLVGCSSLAVWGAHSEGGKLLIGRNFDFYAGDDFAKEKVVFFIRPDRGIPYMSVSWAGMSGVVSGMNLEGLTVTMNAGKSKIPLRAKTPISLVAKEILQYASNISEAISIAQKRKVFVSESLMIGSAKDKKAILIELSPDKMGIFDVENTGKLLCSNHFQSAIFKEDKRNKTWIENGHSLYRWEKLNELTPENDKFTPEKITEILRNTEGLKGENIGYGNEKSLNQLLAHHAVIFSPEEKKVWVSASPYNLGKMLSFNLQEIFSETHFSSKSSVVEDISIGEAPFLKTKEYQTYERFRKLNNEMSKAIEKHLFMYDYQLQAYEESNPNFWYVHYILGKYHHQQGDFDKAKKYWKQALSLEISTTAERQKIENELRKMR